jgi:hypothetical protein
MHVFDKYAPDFWSPSGASCDVLNYVLNMLYRLCYRNWEEDLIQVEQAAHKPGEFSGSCRRHVDVELLPLSSSLCLAGPRLLLSIVLH